MGIDNTSANKQLVDTFYQAFQRKDYKVMADCYHPDAVFRDEAFSLRGKEIGAMWHMLCERGKDLKLDFSVAETNGKITAHWEPKYTFSQTGRFVHNIIDAEFEFEDGKIINHVDSFNFWRWSRQSLGLIGFAMGWSSALKNKVSQMATDNLKRFIEKHAEYQEA